MRNAFYISLVLSFTAISCQPTEKFDREKWTKTHFTLRSNQAKAAIKEKILLDLSLSEVEELIGEATIWETGIDSNATPWTTVFYTVGNCQWIDYERLRIKLVDDKVVEAKIDCW